MKVLVTLPKKKYDSVFGGIDHEGIEFVVNDSFRPFLKSELVEKISDANGVVLGWDCDLDREVIEAGRKLKIIGKVGSGLGNVDCDAAFEKDIAVFNTADAYSNAVAEYVLGAMIDGMRGISYHNHMMKTNFFEKVFYRIFSRGRGSDEFLSPELSFKTVGLVGCGKIARRLVELIRPFGCRILVYDPYLKREDDFELVSLDELFSLSDVVSVHAPLNDETCRMVTSRHLEMLKKDSLFINSARADIVDTEALYALLAKRRFRAVLDVFSSEPLSRFSVLRRLDNVVLSPHIAGHSADADNRHGKIIVSELNNFACGRKLKSRVTKGMLSGMTKK